MQNCLIKKNQTWAQGLFKNVSNVINLYHNKELEGGGTMNSDNEFY